MTNREQRTENREQRTENREQRTEILIPIDFSVKNPNILKIANTICARTDRGISNRKSEGTGVLVMSIIKRFSS